MALYFCQSRIKVLQNLLNKASKICPRLLKLCKSDEILPNLVSLFANGICKLTSSAKKTSLPGDVVAMMGMVPTGRRSLETPKSSTSLKLTSKLNFKKLIGDDNFFVFKI